MSKRGQGRTPEQNRAYMRDYMRKRRMGAGHSGEVRPDVTKAAYDPQRDGPAQHSDLTAVLMGDPPIGRRAIDR